MSRNVAEKSSLFSNTLISRCFCVRHDATRHRLRCVVEMTNHQSLAKMRIGIY